jgi:hypothetical protein
MGVLLPAAAAAEIVVPEGYVIERVADGLNGPEGMALTGAGRLAIVEAQDVPPGAPQELRLSVLNRAGKTVSTVVGPGPGCCWVDVVRDPGRGYFATQIFSRGVQRIGFNGEVGEFLGTSRAAVGIALDETYDDLYVSTAGGALFFGGKIERLDVFGNRSDFRINTRAVGLEVTDGRVLLAAVKQRLTDAGVFDNQVVAYDLVTDEETVLASDLGTDIGFLTVGGEGEIYVSDTQEGVVRRLVPDGAGGYTAEIFVSGLTTSSVRYPGDETEPRAYSWKGLAFAPDGRLYVTDYGAGALYVISEE